MALAGKLEDVPAAEILQFLAMSEKTGKLSFTTGTEEGLIVFREGKIIYAASSSIRETLGSIVMNLKLVEAPELNEALKRQHRTGEEKRLGRILMEMGVLTTGQLQQAMQHQVLNVLREMFSWGRGYFMFRNLEIPDHGEIEVDARDLVVEQPLDARKVALDAARQHDEEQRDRPRTPGGEPPRAFVLDGDDSDAGQKGATGLKDLMGDVSGPTVTAESVRSIFDEAARVFDRGVVFAVHSHGIRGIAQFGLEEEEEPPSQRVRRLWLPIDEPSVISWAINLRSVFRGRPERNRWNGVLFDVLGGTWPEECAAIPILSERRVAMVFYGDNQPHDLPVGSTSALEETLRRVGAELAPTRRAAGDGAAVEQPEA
jgi:hypothetical protein